MNEDGEMQVVGFESYYIDSKNLFLDFMSQILPEYDLYQVLNKVRYKIGWRALYILAFMVGVGADLMVSRMHMGKQLHSRREVMKGHLGYYKKKKWNGRLRGRFETKLQLRGLLFMTLWCNTYGMDQEQLNRILSQVMTLADAATTAARASSSVMEKMENRRDGGGFSEASKILRPPESFEVDDPMRYVAWKESFTNWLTATTSMQSF